MIGNWFKRRYTKKDMPIRLKDYEQQIINALKKNSFFANSKDNFAIVGFSRINVEDEVINAGLVVGSRGVPTVVIISQDTGIVYEVALLILLPELKDVLDA